MTVPFKLVIPLFLFLVALALMAERMRQPVQPVPPIPTDVSFTVKLTCTEPNDRGGCRKWDVR